MLTEAPETAPEPVELSPEQLAARDRMDYRFVLGDPRGVRVITAIMQDCFVDGFQLQGTPENILVMAAQRNIGDQLKARCRRLDPEGWSRLETELTRAFVRHAREQDARDAKTLKDLGQ